MSRSTLLETDALALSKRWVIGKVPFPPCHGEPGREGAFFNPRLK